VNASLLSLMRLLSGRPAPERNETIPLVDFSALGCELAKALPDG